MSGKMELKRDFLQELFNNLEIEEKAYDTKEDAAKCCEELVAALTAGATEDPFTSLTGEGYVNEWRAAGGGSKGCTVL